MKRQILCTAFAAALTLTLAVPAAAEENKIGDVVGHTYYTDIAAQIDGHPLRSYNIGGETAVVAEDLREYGFSVVWDGEARTLTVERDLEGEVTGDYQPQEQPQTVGAQAGDIYYTDIKTYVQGERVTSYAIGGETAIRFSELERTGTLAWEEEERTASLTLAEDPMEFALARMEAERTSGSAEQYAGPYGTAVCFVNGGLSMGTGTFLDYVAANGAVTSITALMPHAGFGAEYYLSPSKIQFDETGRYLTFQSPVEESLNWETGAVKELGVCACTFDTQTKELIWEPLYATLDQWSTQFTYRDMVETWPAGFEIPLSDGEIDILFEKPDGSSSVKESKTDMPSYIMVVEADQNGISIVHPPELFDQSFSATSYGALYQRVRDLGLPDLSAGDTDRTNSPELRQAASALFQAEKNGQPVSGDLWWSQENGDICLNFTFDAPISMSDGDQLTMRLALPEGA